MVSHFMQVGLVFLVVYLQSVTGYLEITPVLNMLNIPWEGKCPLSPVLQSHRQLRGLQDVPVGRCPTVYRVLQLEPGTLPSSVLQGYCDPTCDDSPCNSRGDFKCSNYTVPIQVFSTVVNQLFVGKGVKTLNINVGCICQFGRSHKLKSHKPFVVDWFSTILLFSHLLISELEIEKYILYHYIFELRL